MSARDSGFTLLELLVAMTLLAFLSLAMAAGLRSGTQIWKKSEGANIDTNAIRAAQKTIAQDLARIYPKLVTASATDAYIDFEGGAHQMTFLSSASRPQMTRVAIGAAHGSDGLTLQYDATPELGQNTQSRILLRNLRSLDFAYFGTAGDGNTPSWHDTWHHEHRLPLLVRIRVETPRASASWSELVVRPKIAADVNCTFDAVSKFCQGRQ